MKKFKLLFSNPASLSRGDFDDSMRRGYRGDVIVEIQECNYYEISFLDLINVGYEMDDDMLFYANPNLIVVKEVTLENMTKVVEMLILQDNYFKYRKKIPKSKTKNHFEAQE